MTTSRVCSPIAAVLAAADHKAARTSEALYGERVSLLEWCDGFARIRQHHDGYEGFISREHLEPVSPDNPAAHSATHWVHQRSTLLFREPNFKSPIAHRIPFAAELALSDLPDSPFSQTSCGLFVWTAHCLLASDTHPTDALTLARTHFLGIPYCWGGRSPEGADCSGLVQLLARSQALSIPRDSGDQEQAIPMLVDKGDYRAMDLVYWPGHVGILLSPTELLHSTAYTLDCRVEPLADVVSRTGEVSSVRRLFFAAGSASE